MVFARRNFLLWLMILPLAGCWSNAAKNSNQSAAASTSESAIPFSSKEPETFQTEIVIKTFAQTEKSERRYFLARSGAQRLLIFNRGGRGETAVLQTEDGQRFLLDYQNKTAQRAQAAANGGSDLTAFLTTEYLNQKTGAKFEKIKTENNLTEYRALIENSSTEISITVDENSHLPVKQEFYRAEGDRKTLLYVVELENFKTSADENSFVVPKNFRVIE